MSDGKTSAVDLVSSAYNQGITDGQSFNRGAGILDELKEARQFDADHATLIAALARVGCQDAGSCSAAGDSGLCFVCAALPLVAS
jgi:hypothetical protein